MNETGAFFTKIHAHLVIDDNGKLLSRNSRLLNIMQDESTNQVKLYLLIGFLNKLHEMIQSNLCDKTPHKYINVSTDSRRVSYENFDDFDRSVIYKIKEILDSDNESGWARAALADHLTQHDNPFQMTEDEVWAVTLIHPSNGKIKFRNMVNARQRQSSNKSAWDAALAYLASHTATSASGEDYLNIILSCGALRGSDLIGLQQTFSEWLRHCSTTDISPDRRLAPWESDHLVKTVAAEGNSYWADLRILCEQKKYDEAADLLRKLNFMFNIKILPGYAWESWVHEIVKMQEYLKASESTIKQSELSS